MVCGSGVKLSKFYYYDPLTDSCQAEIGCPVPLSDTSRGNRFFSRLSCLKLCRRGAKQVANCHMEPQSGSCHRYTRRYHYDATSAQCLPFNYSGCEGNNNNFGTHFECNDQCSGASKVHLLQKKPCHLDKDPGIINIKLSRCYFVAPNKYFQVKSINYTSLHRKESCAQ